jgi:hypothetical protein
MTFIKNQAKSLTSDNYHIARPASAGLVLSGESLHASEAYNLVRETPGQKCNFVIARAVSNRGQCQQPAANDLKWKRKVKIGHEDALILLSAGSAK